MNYYGGLILLPVGIIGVIVGIWRSDAQEEAAVERWAAQNGWAVSKDVSLPFEVGGPDDGTGHAAMLLHTTINGRPVAVADYWYRRSHNSWDSNANNRRQMVRRTVTTVRLPQSYPRVRVKRRSGGGALKGFGAVLGGIGFASDPVNSALGAFQRKILGPKTVEVSLGYPPFDQQFEIEAADADRARRLIGRPLVDELVAGSGPTWTLQGYDLYTLQGSSPIVPDEIPALLSSLLRVADLLGR
jgi:hypothetical protein